MTAFLCQYLSVYCKILHNSEMKNIKNDRHSRFYLALSKHHVVIIQLFSSIKQRIQQISTKFIDIPIKLFHYSLNE